MLGLGRRALVQLPTDDSFRLDVHALGEQLRRDRTDDSAHHYVPSGTELNGAFAIRPCYINPRTTLADVDGLAQEVERLGPQVWREHHGEGIVS